MYTHNKFNIKGFTPVGDQLKAIDVLVENTKVNIYIDLSNILFAFRNIDLEIDFLKLNTYLDDRYRPDKIIYFTPNIKSNLNLLSELLIEKTNVEVVLKEIYNENSKVKANCDVEIAHRITRDLDFDFTDTVILVSGDGDFVTVLDYANKFGKKALSVAGTKKSCSILIKRRNYLKYFLLTDIQGLILKDKNFENEKPPIET